MFLGEFDRETISNIENVYHLHLTSRVLIGCCISNHK